DPPSSPCDRSHSQNRRRSSLGYVSAKTPVTARQEIYRAAQGFHDQSERSERGHSLVVSPVGSEATAFALSFFSDRSMIQTPSNKTTAPTLILASATLKTGKEPIEI